ncbi:MAG: hypothetical protein ACYTDY_02185 [Planctomycetota bacterium]|jgi:hypothetical protein
MPGMTLGAYRIKSELGPVGMVTVWLATKDDSRFAVKVVHPHLMDVPRSFKRSSALSVLQGLRGPAPITSGPLELRRGLRYLLVGVRPQVTERSHRRWRHV